MWKGFTERSRQTIVSAIERSMSEGNVHETLARIEKITDRLRHEEPQEAMLQKMFRVTADPSKKPSSVRTHLSFLYKGDGPLAVPKGPFN